MKRGAVRVEVDPRRHNPHAGKDEREREFRKLFTQFKKAVAESGVIHDYKIHETYESKSRKRRRKRKESELARLKGKLRENFFERK